MNMPFDPKAWLASFAEAGGNWMLTSSGPVIGYPVPAPRHLIEMREALNPDEEQAVREHISANAFGREAING